MAKGTYSVVAEAQTISTAITILELTAPATGSVQLLRAWVQQSSSTTSAMARVQILRKTATITGTATPPTVRSFEVGHATTGVTVKWKATAEGTDGNILHSEAFNILNGWLYLPVPEERIWIPPSGLLALKFPAAPTSADYTFGMTFAEIG